MMGRLHVDMFLQDRFLLNGVDVKIRLVRTKDAFALMAGGVNPTNKVNIVDASVFAKKATLSTAVHMAHIKASTKAQPSIHPALLTAKCTRYRRVPCHTRTKTSSWADFPNASCIDNDFNGSYLKKPSHAKHNDINFLAVYVDGRLVPGIPLQPNFGQGRHVRSYRTCSAPLAKCRGTKETIWHALTSATDTPSSCLIWQRTPVTDRVSNSWRGATCASKFTSPRHLRRRWMLLRTASPRRCWKSTKTETSYSIIGGHEADRAGVGPRLNLLFRCRNVPMKTFANLFDTDLVAHDCRVFDWINRSVSLTCCTLNDIYELIWLLPIVYSFGADCT